jgi:hypothetical protein
MRNFEENPGSGFRRRLGRRFNRGSLSKAGPHIRFAVEPFGINQDIPAPAKLPMQASYACFANLATS